MIQIMTYIVLGICVLAFLYLCLKIGVCIASFLVDIFDIFN